MFGYVVLSLQPWMPLNPQGKGMLAPTTILHSVVSFMTNTDLQHYSGDVHFSNFSQIFFCITNFFLSASIGFCSLAAIIRAFRSDKSVGNFFVDMWRVVAYMFVPISFVLALFFLQQGTPMTYQSSYQVATLEPAAMGTTDKGEAKQQTIVVGPLAAFVPMKQLGTNGGGFYGMNSAHPFENPDRLHQLSVVRGHDAVPVCAGADVRPDAWPAAPRVGDFLRDDGVDGGNNCLERLVRHVQAESGPDRASQRRTFSIPSAGAPGGKRTFTTAGGRRPAGRSAPGKPGGQGTALRNLGRGDFRGDDG